MRRTSVREGWECPSAVSSSGRKNFRSAFQVRRMSHSAWKSAGIQYSMTPFSREG
ncbi:hypothetical protein [Streptoalloteichus tenebrarius]|uniref:hypothetical protein n=1 Tax=Streptoalloteichus tenebrarius (strain ATCC 17920 / DSM 40477 / JCM 4838 / CBS 697.72 / NBRC 16177 / NCIMB 11028 / NRRL B-12390 / A12253. 1 / ISP 5477) TaxID=1933 RepID=UPI0020A39D4B|nr:hypothetical protein [Streptoalloteichus tenebrarius]